MKLGDLVKFKVEDKQRIGYILYDYKYTYHIRGIKPKKDYIVLKKNIITVLGGMER
jgi:hypothetical protein